MSCRGDLYLSIVISLPKHRLHGLRIQKLRKLEQKYQDTGYK